MGHRAPQFLVGDFFVGDGFHHIRPGHEHIGTVLDHKNKVGHGGAIDSPPGARPHNERYLRNNARCLDITLKHIGIACQAFDPFLNARPARIIQANHRGANFHRLVHDLADFARMCPGQRAAKNGKILTEHKHQSAIDRTVAGNNTITGNAAFGHAKINAIMFDEHVPFLETVFIKQHIKAFTRGKFAFFVLLVDALLPATHRGVGTHFFEFGNDFLHAG